MYRHFSTGISIPKRWQVHTHLTVTDTYYLIANLQQTLLVFNSPDHIILHKSFPVAHCFCSTDSCAPTITHDIVTAKFNEGFTHDKPVM